MIHSILIIGQSNMAGRGLPGDVEPVNNADEKLKVMRMGRWQNLYRPVNADRKTSGVCLAETFARAYADDKGVTTAIIPCADGGTSLNQWAVGGLLFDHAVYMARLAMRTSNLVAILWHQGEADCREELWPLYYDKITVIMKELRRALGAEDVPLLVGGLGDFLTDRAVINPQIINYPRVNEQLERFANDTHRCAFVSAEGLTANSDNLHFNAKSLHEFGYRYYNEFLKIEDKNRVFEEKPDMSAAFRTDMELL